MTTMSVPKSRARRRTREAVFLLFSSGVFLFGVTAVSAICIVCAYPATVTALG